MIDAEQSKKTVETPDRYQALVQLWIHHNATQLQWPAIVIGAALLVASSQNVADNLSAASFMAFGFEAGGELPGALLLIAGSGIMCLVYIMRRSRFIMGILEREIATMEDTSWSSFAELNHPKGYSGPRLVRRFIISTLALPLIFLGGTLLFSFAVAVAITTLLLFCYLRMVVPIPDTPPVRQRLQGVPPPDVPPE